MIVFDPDADTNYGLDFTTSCLKLILLRMYLALFLVGITTTMFTDSKVSIRCYYHPHSISVISEGGVSIKLLFSN